MMADIDPVLKAQLVFFEGYRASPYVDGSGKITIGIGYNLTDDGVPGSIIDELYTLSVGRAQAGLDAIDPWWRGLDPVRGRALQNFIFNVGQGTYRTFSTFRGLMQAGQYEQAGADLAAQAWYGQVGRRGPMLVSMIQTGQDPDISGG